MNTVILRNPNFQNGLSLEFITDIHGKPVNLKPSESRECLKGVLNHPLLKPVLALGLVVVGLEEKPIEQETPAVINTEEPIIVTTELSVTVQDAAIPVPVSDDADPPPVLTPKPRRSRKNSGEVL